MWIIEKLGTRVLTNYPLVIYVYPTSYICIPYTHVELGIEALVDTILYYIDNVGRTN